MVEIGDIVRFLRDGVEQTGVVKSKHSILDWNTSDLAAISWLQVDFTVGLYEGIQWVKEDGAEIISMNKPDFDLDDIEIAEIIMNEMK